MTGLPKKQMRRAWRPRMNGRLRSSSSERNPLHTKNRQDLAAPFAKGADMNVSNHDFESEDCHPCHLNIESGINTAITGVNTN